MREALFTFSFDFVISKIRGVTRGLSQRVANTSMNFVQCLLLYLIIFLGVNLLTLQKERMGELANLVTSE